MNLTIIGGWGGWPAAGGACSGYLVEHLGFRLLVDPGYGVMSRLLHRLAAHEVDAVLVSHGHPDHCADLNPLLRARAFMEDRPAPLPLYALPGSLDAVLALDRAEMLAGTYDLRPFEAGESILVGPMAIETRLLPHPRPNAGFRIAVDGATLVYTGDAGPSDALVDLARDADVLLAESSYADSVPDDLLGSLSSAADAAREATAAGVSMLVLTHLLPGEDRRHASRVARGLFSGPVRVARAGMTIVVGTPSIPHRPAADGAI